MGAAGPARIIFAGSPDFAVPSLEALAVSGNELVTVLTQPDRPAGRGRVQRASPVKTAADALGIEVLQPESFRDAGIVEGLASLQADLMVVVAYGLLLPSAVLGLPRAGCVNVHASLLPRWRGAAPIQAAILAGDTHTGVSLMKMDAGLDTGPVYATAKTAIGPAETAGRLHDRLASMGAELLAGHLAAILEGSLESAAQPEDGACYAGRISKSDGEIQWSQPAAVILRMVRAYDPWPVAWTTLDGKRLRIWSAAALSGPFRGQPGDIVDVADDGLIVLTGEGALRVSELQLQGRARCTAQEFANGYAVLGKRLGP